MNFKDHSWYMKMALEEADKAYRLGEVPVGAVIVSEQNSILSRAHNLKESNFNPCAHAELLAVTAAAKKINNWRLVGATIYVSLEPCPMCMSALTQARIKTLIFGAYDKKGGALSLGHNLHQDRRVNHQFSVIGGIDHYACAKILSQFFKERRDVHRTKWT